MCNVPITDTNVNTMESCSQSGNANEFTAAPMT